MSYSHYQRRYIAHGSGDNQPHRLRDILMRQDPDKEECQCCHEMRELIWDWSSKRKLCGACAANVSAAARAESRARLAGG